MSSFLLRSMRAPAAARAFSTSSARNSFAKITMIGRLADVPELQATSSGAEILKYTVVTDSGPKDNKKASFFKVASFIPDGPQREFISSLDKGTLVYVEGDAKLDTYQDGEGKNRTTLAIIHRKMEVLSPKKRD